MSSVSATEQLGERDPKSAFLVRDERFRAVVGDAPQLVRVVETNAHEGPVYVADEDALYFTTAPRRRDGIPEVSIARLQLDGMRFPLERGRLSVVVEQANVANGMVLDREGRLVICEQGTLTQPARLRRLDLATRELETLVDAVHGLPLNSPNDVVVRSDGTIWFTDPSYGFLQGFRPEPLVADRVYRYEPRSGDLSVGSIGFDKPNGLAFSPDERTLYVADNGAPHYLLAFDVEEDGSLTGRRRLAVGTPEHPDGLKVDSAGHIYASARHGVQVLDPSGRLLGEISLPGTVNFTFGGRGRNVLFITTDTAVWAAVLNAKGA